VLFLHSPIGQVTLDKEKNIRTVINKVEALGSESTYRFFKMELLAGEEDYVTQLRVQRCVLTLDYSKVYWNSRLCYEHEIVVKLFQAGEVVLDVFAGVGPFAIPAAKLRRCLVHANDLNPHSYAYLQKNIKDNGVTGEVKAYNLDGKEFIVKVSKTLIDQSLQSAKNGGGESLVPYSHVIMNLPGDAPSFLRAFRGIFSSVPANLRDTVVLPQIHCHCFVDTKEKNCSEVKALEKVKTHLGVENLEKGSYSITCVRDVSVVSMMMRVSFRLPPEVAYSSRTGQTRNVEDTSSGGSPGTADVGGCGKSGGGGGCGMSESSVHEEMPETEKSVDERDHRKCVLMWLSELVNSFKMYFQCEKKKSF